MLSWCPSIVLYLHCRRITDLVRLDTSNCEMSYQPGDTVCVYSRNNPKMVDTLFTRVTYDVDFNALVNIQTKSKGNSF